MTREEQPGTDYYVVQSLRTIGYTDEWAEELHHIFSLTNYETLVEDMMLCGIPRDIATEHAAIVRRDADIEGDKAPSVFADDEDGELETWDVCEMCGSLNMCDCEDDDDGLDPAWDIDTEIKFVHNPAPQLVAEIIYKSNGEQTLTKHVHCIKCGSSDYKAVAMGDFRFNLKCNVCDHTSLIEFKTEEF